MPDPDFEIRRGAVIQTVSQGGGGWGAGLVSKKIFFRPFGPRFGLKLRGEPGSPPAPPLDPPLQLCYFGKSYSC